jgi:hypothetical protein
MFIDKLFHSFVDLVAVVAEAHQFQLVVLEMASFAGQLSLLAGSLILGFLVSFFVEFTKGENVKRTTQLTRLGRR